jgi:hypothetical protein
MSFNPLLGTLETLHERPTRASEAWKMEERRAARRRVDGVFILGILLYFSVEEWLLPVFKYLFLAYKGFDTQSGSNTRCLVFIDLKVNR